MTTGTIIAWKKKPGDALNPGDLIAEVGTDKATVDFEVQDSGYLAKVLVPDGTAEVKVGSIIAIMVESPEAVAAFAAIPAEALTGEGSAAPAAAPAPPQAAPAPQQPKAAAPAAAPVAAASSTPAPAASSHGGKVVASPLAKKVSCITFYSKGDLAPAMLID
jgi:pyruvate dehydrogenase E2 component (dihydrolipoamide acetyltransferase)